MDESFKLAVRSQEAAACLEVRLRQPFAFRSLSALLKNTTPAPAHRKPQTWWCGQEDCRMLCNTRFWRRDHPNPSRYVCLYVCRYL